MRFVTPKLGEQQAQALRFRGRERLVRQRTELVNALRSVLYEFGYPIPPGVVQLTRIEAMVEAENSDLPELVRDECRDILLQIAEKTQRIEAKAKQISALAKITVTARRLQTMPGVGPMSWPLKRLLHPWKAFGVGETLRPGWVWCRASIRREERSGSDEYRRPDKPIYAGS